MLHTVRRTPLAHAAGSGVRLTRLAAYVVYFHPTSLREVGWKHTFQRKKDDVVVVFVEVLLFQHHLTTKTTNFRWGFVDSQSCRRSSLKNFWCCYIFVPTLRFVSFFLLLRLLLFVKILRLLLFSHSQTRLSKCFVSYSLSNSTRLLQLRSGYTHHGFTKWMKLGRYQVCLCGLCGPASVKPCNQWYISMMEWFQQQHSYSTSPTTGIKNVNRQS